jgi:hypothetical protein
MKNYGEFHDGAFEGLWIDGKTAHVFLATEGRERFVIVAEKVIALAVDGVKAGNIIFEVLEHGPEELSYQDIQALYALEDSPSDKAQGANLIAKARNEGWRILEINPSYGASCLVLTSSLELLSRKAWLERYVLDDSRLPTTAADRCSGAAVLHPSRGNRGHDTYSPATHRTATCFR